MNHLFAQRGSDHVVRHQVSSPAPDAVALVNPQLLSTFNPPTPIPTQLHRALFRRPRVQTGACFAQTRKETGLAGAAEFDLRPLLDLVALGTIADLVPLTGENRILVSAGLQRLNTTQRPGLVALKQVAQCPSQLGTYEVGFQLGPRLNAAGRLETAEESLQLLLARDLAGAMPLAQNLDSRNRERQKIERGIAEEVIGIVKSKFDPQNDFVIVEGQLLWHIGVVGIVASRVLQQFYRPTIFSAGKAACGAVRAGALWGLIWPPRCANAAICSAARRSRNGGGTEPSTGED